MSIKLLFPPSTGLNAMSTPPLGIALLQSQLKSQGVVVGIDDLWIKTKSLGRGFYHKWSSDYLKECIENARTSELEQYGCSVLNSVSIPQEEVGFSVLAEPQLYPSLALAWYLNRKGKKVILGGKFFTLIDGNQLLSKYDFISKVLHNLGELSSYLNLPLDISSANPDFSGLPMNLYKTKIKGKRKLVLPFMLLEGCNKNCAFCIEHTPLGNVPQTQLTNFVKAKVEQIVELKTKYNTPYFFFVDCAINNNPIVFREFIQRLEGENIQWGAFANVGGLNVDTANQMKRAGCKYLLMGCESGSQRVLKSMNKPHLVRYAEQAIKNTNKAGIFNHCFFIVNFPTEKKEDFKQTLRFLVRNRRYIDDAFTEIFDLRVGSYVSSNPGKFGVTILKTNGLLSQSYRLGELRLGQVKMTGILRHYQAEVVIAAIIKLRRFINHPTKAFSRLLYSRLVLQRSFPLDRLFDYV